MVYENGAFISLTDFCLSESVRPTQIEFGTNSDMNNNEYISDTRMLLTFFKFDSAFFMVAFDKTDSMVAFGVSEKHSLNPYDYSDDRKKTSKALKVFGNVLFVLMEMLKHNKPKFIKFESANPALGSVYDRMVKNKFVSKYISDFGYTYSGLDNGKHIYKKM